MIHLWYLFNPRVTGAMFPIITAVTPANSKDWQQCFHDSSLPLILNDSNANTSNTTPDTTTSANMKNAPLPKSCLVKQRGSDWSSNGGNAAVATAQKKVSFRNSIARVKLYCPRDLTLWCGFGEEMIVKTFDAAFLTNDLHDSTRSDEVV